MFHIDCFVNFQASTNKYQLTDPGGITHPTCSLGCSGKKTKELKQETNKPAADSADCKIAWDNDGPTDQVSSLSILIDWLTTEGNNTKYHGCTKDQSLTEGGVRKSEYQQQICNLIAAAGIKTPRTPSAVKNKIEWLASMYTGTSDWINQTGSGITDELDLQTAVLKRFPHFYILDPIFSEQGNATGFTNENGALDEYEYADTDDFDSDTDTGTSTHSISKSVIDETPVRSNLSTSAPVSSLALLDDSDSDTDTGTSTSTNNRRGTGTSSQARNSSSYSISKSVIDETPVRSNLSTSAPASSLALLNRETKKALRGDTKYKQDAAETDFYNKRLKIQQDELDMKKKKHDMEMSSLVEEEKRKKMRWWVEAVSLGIYENIEEARIKEPL